MKLLILSNNPLRASFRQRIGIYMDLFQQMGIHCRLEKIPGSLSARIKLFMQAKNYDGVLLHKKCLNCIDAPVLRHCARRIIYDFDDAVMYSPFRPDKLKYSHMQPFCRTVRIADHVIAGNEYLAEFARPYCKHVEVVPTGLCTERYRDGSRSNDRSQRRLVWIGSQATLAYLDQIGEVLEKIGRRYPNVVLRIIADEFIDLRWIHVEKHRWSFESEVQDLLDSDIGLAPLPDNPFTRGKCGFKILQYFAASLPCVASPVGMNTNLVQDNQTGLLARTPDEWFNALSRLIEEPETRIAMGVRACQFVHDYDVSRIGKRIVSLITKVLNAPVKSR